MESFLISAASFLVMLLVWLVRSIFGHGSRIKANETKIADLEKIDIGPKLANHEARIKGTEDDVSEIKAMHQLFIGKFESLIESSARIEGALKGKKDKE